MPRRAPKKYNVTITYCEHTPEEEARISEQVREAIYQAKMIAIKKREEARQRKRQIHKRALPHEKDKL